MEAFLEWLGDNADALGVMGAAVAGTAAAIVWLVNYRRSQTVSERDRAKQTVEIQHGSNLGIIAGGNVTVGTFVSNNTDEIIKVLAGRAETINKELSNNFKYAKVQSYLEEFNRLHKKHIEALRKGNFVLAHELLNEIHEISSKLSADEFWAEHRKLRPNVRYSLRPDAFTRGAMICGYLVGDMTDHSKLYPSDERSVFSEKGIKLNSDELYKLIVSTG